MVSSASVGGRVPLGRLHDSTEALAQDITGVGDHGESIFVRLLDELL